MNFSCKPTTWGSWMICGVSILGLAGCARPSGPPRAAVSGEVIFDTQPLESGRITFTPVDGTKGPSAVTLVTDGFYAFEHGNGPVIGKNRIQIESLFDPGFELDDEQSYANAVQQKQGQPVIPRDVIPSEYNQRSRLVEEVSTDGDLQIDFSLERKTAHRSP